MIIFTIVFGYITFISLQNFLITKFDNSNGMFLLYILSFIAFGFFFIMCLIFLILHLFGYLKGKRKIRKIDEYIEETNPYIYYRELPNPYGVGIASLLLDSKMENEKDIVAIILNLCAKKYLYLNVNNEKYTITILKDIDNKLVANEEYIMNLILNNSLDKLDYNELFNKTIQDGAGLYFNTPSKYHSTPGFMGLGDAYKGGYASSLKSFLEPTEEGIKQIHKLNSFKKFLEDFGSFAEKNPEEIVLWDYYLCYAQVFGLTDKILKTGYDKLIKNASFEIKDIDSIHLNEIKIKK